VESRRRYRVTDSSKERKKRTKAKSTTKQRRSKREKEVQKKLEATEKAVEEVESKAKALEEQCSQLQDDNLRLLAEMDNARKRTDRRIENERRAVLVDAVKPLLDVADDLERAVRSAEENHDANAIMEGVRMVQQRLVQVFAGLGISPIDTSGQLFDYNVHEAVGHAPSGDHAENEIIAEISRGYLLNGELLRPSKVIIARAPDEEK
jgi:molecular chaperone GrpE